MKKCPQCNTLYEDQTQYCLTDGALLVGETFSPPSAFDSEEPETVVKNTPIVIDLPRENEPTVELNRRIPPENVSPALAVAASANRNYALFLVIGLLVGGGLVLGTLLISKTLFQSDLNNADKAEKPVNYNQAAKEQPSAENSDDGENDSGAVASDKHLQPNEAAGEDFNGRVIALNARVRALPDKDAAVLDTLPMNDRLNIVGRENARSPWFEVECEHGASGWMHGDTIEFTRPPV